MRVTNPTIPFLILVFAAIFAFCMFGHAAADYETNQSTNCTGAPTLAVIPGTNPGDVLGSLIINTRATAAETLKIYDSSGTANNLIGTIDISSGILNGIGVGGTRQFVYNMRISSAITVTKSAGTADLTIIWRKTR